MANGRLGPIVPRLELEDASPADNKGHDSPAELASYRKPCLNTITRAPRGELTHITRNSPVFTTMNIGITNKFATARILNHLSKFVFGSEILGDEVERAIKGDPGGPVCIGQNT